MEDVGASKRTGRRLIREPIPASHHMLNLPEHLAEVWKAYYNLEHPCPQGQSSQELQPTVEAR